MRAEILVPQAVRGRLAAERLYSYRVPEALIATIAVGHLVAIPFGERTTAGIVWALDASDELIETGSPLQAHPPLRAIARLLLPEPVLSNAHHALAEWISDYYAAPLADAARLMLPPGLLSSMREVLLPAEKPPSDDIRADELAPDAAMMLGLLRERGRLERTQIREALGAQRARAAISALLASGFASLVTEIAGAQREQRRERLIRLSGSSEQIAAWQRTARAALDERISQHPAPVVGRQKAPSRRSRGEEQHSERLLRQLAVLDVLSRAGLPQSWRLEELQRLTRATTAALRDLQTAGLIAIDEVTARHDPLTGRSIAHTSPLPLTDAQARALATITAPRASASRASHVYLLHGITGSGKTEIYLQALAETLARGERGIVLVPEIALTPQALERYAGRFPGRVALLHSGLTDAERLDEWRRIRAGAVDVVLGSRSALFAPVERLGLIVVDEEHEGAYKQDRRPTYHARDVAIRLGALSGATVVLGSATPSVESYWRAQTGEYTLVELHERAPTGTPDAPPTGLPPVTLVDLRAELREGNTSILSDPLVTALHETLERGEQAILFLNRRGMASMIVCRECGYVARCTHCDISMTLHASERAIICHYCGRKASVPHVCPICHSTSIRFFGLGTERVESAVKRRFPAARVLRWDRDTAKNRQTHEELLRAFAERRADVLVGTQMIAKGLDLPAVTLVGVVSADIALFLPDFRASERTFQLLTQVAGRAGRGAQAGRALVQTFNPDHFCIQSAARHDFAGFVSAEVAARQRYGYPPFRRFMKCTFTHRDRHTAQVEATAFANLLEHLLRDLDLPQSDIVGPAPAFMERLRGAYRWQVIVRGPELRPLLHALAHEDLPRGWVIDIDPASTL